MNIKQLHDKLSEILEATQDPEMPVWLIDAVARPATFYDGEQTFTEGRLEKVNLHPGLLELFTESAAALAD